MVEIDVRVLLLLRQDGVSKADGLGENDAAAVCNQLLHSFLSLVPVPHILPVEDLEIQLIIYGVKGIGVGLVPGVIILGPVQNDTHLRDLLRDILFRRGDPDSDNPQENRRDQNGEKDCEFFHTAASRPPDTERKKEGSKIM